MGKVFQLVIFNLVLVLGGVNIDHQLRVWGVELASTNVLKNWKVCTDYCVIETINIISTYTQRNFNMFIFYLSIKLFSLQLYILLCYSKYIMIVVNQIIL